jgi:hypothetical protein
MTSNTRAQRLVDEFEEGSAQFAGFSVRHGIAAVLRHLADDVLEAPTLLERAMKGDAAAAKQFLHEAGFTDKQGYFLPQYQPRDNGCFVNEDEQQKLSTQGSRIAPY